MFTKASLACARDTQGEVSLCSTKLINHL